MSKSVTLICLLSTAISVHGMDLQVVSFPEAMEYKDYGPSNLYHIVCCNNTTNGTPFSIKCMMEENYCTPSTSWTCIDGVIRASIIKNSHTNDGFLLLCQHGPDSADVGCNMVYYVGSNDRTIAVKPISSLLRQFDFGRVEGRRGKTWGVIYLHESDTRDEMTFAVKVGYGVGTNQIFIVGLRDFNGCLTRMVQKYDYPIITEQAPEYEYRFKTLGTDPN